MGASFELISGGHYVCTPAWVLPKPAFVDYHRFYFPGRGRGAVVRAGRTETRVRAGRVYFFPGGRAYSYRCDGEVELDWLHVRAADPRTDALLSRIPGHVEWPASAWAFWRSTYRRSAELFEKRPPMLVARFEAMLLYVAAELVEREVARGGQPRQRDHELERLLPALSFMDERFRDNPPLRELADRVHLSPVYFHRLFTRAMRTTPHDYMLRKRMELARRLLVSTTEPIKAIASAVGYPNVFYFSRTVKRVFGRSPRVLRASERLAEP